MRLFKQAKSKHWWADHFVDGKRHRRSMATPNQRKAESEARKWIIELEQRCARIIASTVITPAGASDAFLKHCRVAGLAKSTMANYRVHLRRFSDYCGDCDLTLWMEQEALDIVTKFLEWNVSTHSLSSPHKYRLTLSTYFNFLDSRRWYCGRNPAESKRHLLRSPRKKLKAERCTKRHEDRAFYIKGEKHRLWPVLMLARWAGLRRGEACLLRWDEINFKGCYVNIVGNEGARKHPRKVWVAPWIVLDLLRIRAEQNPVCDRVWPFNPDRATRDMKAFCERHLSRRVTFHDLRASFVTDFFERGGSAMEESRLVGHSAEVAEKYYSEFTARAARDKLPFDPRTETRSNETEVLQDARAAATMP